MSFKLQWSKICWKWMQVTTFWLQEKNLNLSLNSGLNLKMAFQKSNVRIDCCQVNGSCSSAPWSKWSQYKVNGFTHRCENQARSSNQDMMYSLWRWIFYKKDLYLQLQCMLWVWCYIRSLQDKELSEASQQDGARSSHKWGYCILRWILHITLCTLV